MASKHGSSPPQGPKSKRRLVSPVSSARFTQASVGETQASPPANSKPLSTSSSPSRARPRGPKPPNESKFLAKMITNPRHAAARALAVSVATEAASLSAQGFGPVALETAAEDETNLAGWKHDAASNRAGGPAETSAAPSRTGPSSPPPALDGEERPQEPNFDQPHMDQSPAPGYLGGTAVLLPQGHTPLATATAEEDRTSSPSQSAPSASEPRGDRAESEDERIPQARPIEPFPGGATCGPSMPSAQPPCQGGDEGTVPHLSGLEAEQCCPSDEEQERMVQERTRLSCASDPEDERDAEEIDRSLPSIQLARSPSGKHDEVSGGAQDATKGGTSRATVLDDESIASHLSHDPVPQHQLLNENGEDRSGLGPIDLTTAVSTDSSVATRGQSESKQSGPSSSDEEERSLGQTDGYENGEQAPDEDPWLLRRALLHRPHVPEQRPDGLERRPSPALRGPLAKAMAGSSLAGHTRPYPSASARITAIGAKALRRSASTTLLTAPALHTGPPSSTPNVSLRSSLKDATESGLRSVPQGSRAARARNVESLIRLLRSMQPSERWDASANRNVVDTILKGSRVLKALEESPNTASHEEQDADTREEYYQRKAAEFFLRREKDALSSIGPSPAKAEEYAQLRASQVAKQKALRGILGRQPLPSHLTEEQEKVVRTAMKQRELSISIPGAQVAHADLLKLRPGQWLNDESINFYGQLVLQRSQRAAAARSASPSSSEGESPSAVWDVHVFSSFFYHKLATAGPASVARWTRRLDVLSKDKILFPVNLGNTHWATGCINLRQKRIEYYDSLHTPNPRFFRHVRAWLQAEHETKRGAPLRWLDEGWVEYTNPRFPGQTNGFDCGVFTLAALEQLSRRDPLDPYPLPYAIVQPDETHAAFNFSGKDMPYLRRRFAYEIITKHLLD